MLVAERVVLLAVDDRRSWGVAEHLSIENDQHSEHVPSVLLCLVVP